MTSETVRDFAEVVGVALLLAASLFVVGLAVRAVLAPLVRLGRSAGLTVGLGIMPVVLGVVAARALHLRVAPWPWVVLGAAVVVLTVTGSLAERHERGSAWAWLRTQGPTRFDAIALVAGLAVLAPVLAHGLTYWTKGVNDFPSYAASAQVWLDGPSATPWLQAHPDFFGSSQLNRARFEKPMATAILIAGQAFTGTPAARLLGPLTLVAIVVLVATLSAVALRVARPSLAVVGAVLAPSMSAVPMSRALDAQLGQVLALALFAVCLATVLGEVRPRHRHGEIAPGVLTGLVAAATLGMNATLVVGTGLTAAAVGAWLLVKSRARLRPALVRVAWAAGTFVILAAPFVRWYRKSLKGETGGEQGYSIKLASPLSLVGLQTDIASAPTHAQAAVEWAALLAVAAIAYVWAKRLRPGLPISGGLAVVVLLNGLVVLGRYGSDSYILHKWLAVAIPLAMPFLLIAAVERMPRAAGPVPAASLSAVAVLSLVNSAVAAAAVPAKVPDTLWSLASSSCPKGVSTLNIETGSIYEDSLAPLVACTPTTVVVGHTYATVAAPVGDTFLTHTDNADSLAPRRATPLAAPYTLATLDLHLETPTSTTFGSSDKEAQKYLYGTWLAPEDGGVWSSGTVNRIVFDVPDSLRGKTLTITLSGARAAEPTAHRDLIVKVGGTKVASATYTSLFELKDVTFTLPASRVVDGRVAIELDTAHPIVPKKYGQADNRSLSYYLHTMMVDAAAS